MTHEKWEVPSPGGSPGLRLSLVTQERLHQRESSGRGLRKGSSPGAPKAREPRRNKRTLLFKQLFLTD